MQVRSAGALENRDFVFHLSYASYRRLLGSIVLALALAVAVVQFLYRIPNGYSVIFDNDWRAFRTHADFNHFYGTSYLTLHGIVPYGIPFESLPISDQFVWHKGIPSATNPPALALLLAPLALFDRDTAWWIWVSMIVAAQVVCGSIVSRTLGAEWRTVEKVLWWAVFLGGSAFASNIVHAQVQTIILLLAVMGWSRMRNGTSLVGAAAWGIATGLKIFPWPLVAILILLKRFREAGVSIASALFICAAPMALFGWTIWLKFFTEGIPIIQQWAGDSTLNIGVTGVINRFSLFWSAGGLEGSIKWLAFGIIPLLSFFALVGAFFWRRDAGILLDKAEFDLLFAAITVFAHIFAPTAWPSYLICLPLLMAVLWTHNSHSPQFGFLLFLVWFFIPQHEPLPESWEDTASTCYWAFWSFVAGLLMLASAVWMFRRQSRCSDKQTVNE